MPARSYPVSLGGLVAAAVVTVALSACGGSGADADTTSSPAVAGPPVPSTTLPAWIPPALGVAGEDAFLEVVAHDLVLRGLKYSFDEQQGTVTLLDGRVLALSPIAQVAAESDPTTWPRLVSRSFDALLAP